LPSNKSQNGNSRWQRILKHRDPISAGGTKKRGTAHSNQTTKKIEKMRQKLHEKTNERRGVATTGASNPEKTKKTKKGGGKKREDAREEKS